MPLCSVCSSYAIMPSVESDVSIYAKCRCSCAPFVCSHSPRYRPITRDTLSSCGLMVSTSFRSILFVAAANIFRLYFYPIFVTQGFFCGGYHYSLRVYLFERVRARNFSQAWSFFQCSQSIPIVVGISLAEFLNCHVSPKSGYLFGFFCTLIGSILLFLVDVHKRNISRHRHIRYAYMIIVFKCQLRR